MLPLVKPGFGHQRTLTTVSFYGDSFVKPILVARAAMFARVPVWLDRSIWQIRGWDVRKACPLPADR